MYSTLPKVLHRIADRPLLEHITTTAQLINPSSIYVVYGHGGERVPEALPHLDVKWVHQDRQLGTGHAVEQALPEIPDDHLVLVLYGDVPLTGLKILKRLIYIADGDSVALLTVRLADPTGYGRIIRGEQGEVRQIIEDRDASEQQRRIQEVNTGILCAPADRLKTWLKTLENNNAQGEFYLTDIIAKAVDDGVSVNTVTTDEPYEVLGINNKLQLAELERYHQRKQAETLMLQGLTLRDPERFDLRGELSVGQDVEIDVNVIIQGKVRLGNNVKISSNCVITDAVIGDDVILLPNTVVEGAEIGAGSKVGPFARLRPGTRLVGNNHIGNFVELKKAKVDLGSKINHLSYVGDALVGKTVNIGAGTITCNYDGANKHLTEIGDNVFVGSCTQLVAPVKVGEGVTIGAGSTITKDIPPQVLALSRARQIVREGWKRPQKKRPDKNKK